MSRYKNPLYGAVHARSVGRALSKYEQTGSHTKMLKEQERSKARGFSALRKRDRLQRTSGNAIQGQFGKAMNAHNRHAASGQGFSTPTGRKLASRASGTGAKYSRTVAKYGLRKTKAGARK